MKLKYKAVTAVLLAVLMVFTGCGKSKDQVSEKSSSDAEATTEWQEVIVTANPDAEPKSGAQPVLALSSAEGKPGETVDMTLSVSGADQKWAMCGIHITYDERLVGVPNKNDEKTPAYKKGSAISDFDAAVAMFQIGSDRNEYLIENKLSSIFFAAVGSDNVGKDGDIVTFQLTIPEDAEPGTEYELGIYYRSEDMFMDIDRDEAIQDYAFSHYQTGKITVK